MPKLEGSETTPTTLQCRVPKPSGATTWDEPMWIVRIVYTDTELDMLSAEFVVGFEHPRGSNFYSDESSGVSWFLRVWTRACGS